MPDPGDHRLIEKQIERAVKQYDGLQSFFPRVEARAAFLFTLNITMAGVSTANLPDIVGAWPAVSIATLLVVALTAGIACALLVFTTHLKNLDRKSLLFFGDIASFSASEYQAADAAETADRFLDDLRCQNWRNAQILTHKYRWVGLSFNATVVAIPLWVIFLVIAAFITGHTPLFRIN